MFGIDSSELAVIALVALLVIGPKDLPRVMRMVGQWMAKARGMTRHVRAGFDTMMREAELEEMRKQWAAQNEAIMKASALPDLGIREALPDMTVPNLSADEWMSPGAGLAPVESAANPAPDNIDEPATEAAPPPAKPRRNRAKAADAPAAGVRATDVAPEAALKPRKPRRKAEPQPTES